MTPVLSPNTQAILLLTAPLIAGRGTASSDLLSPGEYKRLARHLREIQRQPADLLSPNAAEILRACQPVIDESRLQKLLGRGFLLSQVIERWQARAIWVVSRADAEYPRRLKTRLREDAPAVLYGCGDMALLETGGLAVVGSRHVDDALIDYTMAVGRLAARAGRTLVSGGAKGIDQAAMRGALEGGGKVCGVLADSLEKMLASGAFQKGDVDLALRLALEALEERSADAMINRNINNLQSSLIEGYATSMGAWGLSDAEQKLAQKAFGMLIDAPLRQSRSFDLRTSAIASSTKAAADAAKTRRLAAE